MAYTIIEVERQTGISSHTLRFWIKKGLFPFIQRDKNGVKYFSQRDIDWALWVECLRSMQMSLEDIKKYILSASQGMDSIKERKEMLCKQRNKVKQLLKTTKKSLEMVEHKIKIYEEMIQSGKDLLNPESKDYYKNQE
ncbi:MULTISPECIES: MerR family transcriptional regulator [unclassified Helicobacter]|uniref:MerR family transcriptional regulator n=1 Tax=unclassified Helicobacter TaxID=2593540 RepID=UPI000CF0D2F8|nr:MULTISPECIES: MerR family transcriptional regulator [unclassified Helicobacter]